MEYTVSVVSCPTEATPVSPWGREKMGTHNMRVFVQVGCCMPRRGREGATKATERERPYNKEAGGRVPGALERRKNFRRERDLC